jgi:cytochrome P450
MRQRGGVKDYARSQFVAANEQNLGFGYGQHACPGRFFAANEIKMMIVRLILDYDIKNVAGELGMYPAIEIGRNIIPDPHKMLMFKKL